MSHSESLEVTAIHSVAGLLSGETPLITRPPFMAPHHSSTVAALVGGGSGMARPGAVSRAHRGVLFLDECAEISVSALESLRTPLEDGEIRLARRDGVGALSRSLPTGAGCQPVSVCTGRSTGLHMYGGGQAALPGRAHEAIARSSGPACADESGSSGGIFGCRRRVDIAGSPPGDAGPRRGRRTLATTRVSARTPTSFFFCDGSSVPATPPWPRCASTVDRGLLSLRGVDRTLRVAWSLDRFGRPGLAEGGMRLRRR